jgi:hypothetical protein
MRSSTVAASKSCSAKPDEGVHMATSEPTDGIAHLQKAALEMIAAARAFLEVAEKVVENPESVRNAVATVGTLAKLVAQSADAPKASKNGDHPESTIEHIELS